MNRAKPLAAAWLRHISNRVPASNLVCDPFQYLRDLGGIVRKERVGAGGLRELAEKFWFRVGIVLIVEADGVDDRVHLERVLPKRQSAKCKGARRWDGASCVARVVLVVSARSRRNARSTGTGPELRGRLLRVSR